MDGFVLCPNPCYPRAEAGRNPVRLQTLRATGPCRMALYSSPVRPYFGASAVELDRRGFRPLEAAPATARCCSELLKSSITERRVLAFDYYGQNGAAARRTVETGQLRVQREFRGTYRRSVRDRRSFPTFKLSRMGVSHCWTGPLGAAPDSRPALVTGIKAVSVPTTRIADPFPHKMAFRVYDEFGQRLHLPAAGRIPTSAGPRPPVGARGCRLSAVLARMPEIPVPRPHCAATSRRKQKIAALYSNARTRPLRYPMLQWSHQTERMNAMLQYETVSLPARNAGWAEMPQRNADPPARRRSAAWGQFMRAGLMAGREGAPCYDLYQLRLGRRGYGGHGPAESEACPAGAVPIETPAGEYAKFHFTAISARCRCRHGAKSGPSPAARLQRGL